MPRDTNSISQSCSVANSSSPARARRLLPSRACAGLAVGGAGAAGAALLGAAGVGCASELLLRPSCALQEPCRMEIAAGSSTALSLLEARYSPPSLSLDGTVPAFLLRDEEDLRVREEEEGAAAARQRLPSLPCPAGAYELRQKDLGKLHRAAASGDLAQVRQGLKK